MEWNFLKKNENKSEKHTPSADNITEKKPSIEAKVSEVGIRLNSLLEAVNALGDENLETLSDKDFDKIIMNNLGESWEDFLANIKLDHDANHLLENFNDSIKEIVLLKDGGKNNDPSGFIMKGQEAWKKSGKMGRAAVIFALLSLKFAVPVMAGEAKNNSSKETNPNKIEVKASDTHKADNGKTIKWEPKFGGEHNEHVDGPLKIDLSNSFETAKAAISPENQKNIEATFHDFLSKINHDNYKQFAFSNWTIEGSSDERPIPIEGGNEKLTHDRVNSLKPLLQSALEKFDFSHSGLSKTEIKALKDKAFGEKIPSGGNGHEAGVTYLTDLSNPATGQHYTADEISAIKANNPDKYQDLLKECRYTKLNLEGGGEYPTTLTQAGQHYDKVTMLIDKSGSMFDSKDYIADNIEKNINDVKSPTKYAVGFFSDALHSMEDASDLKDACHKIKAEHNLGYAHEKMLSSTVSALEKILEANHGQKVEGKQVLVVATDEAIQDVSVNSLKAIKDLSIKTGVEVKLLMGLDENNRVVEISVDNLLDKAQDLMNKANHAVVAKMAKLEKISPDKLSMEDQKFMNNFNKEMVAFEKQEHEVRNFEFDNNGQIASYEAPVY